MNHQIQNFASKPNIINGHLECGSEIIVHYLQALADKGVIAGESQTLQITFPIVPEMFFAKQLVVGNVKTFRSMVFVERIDIKTRTLKSVNVHEYSSPETACQFAAQFKRGLYGALALSEACVRVAEVAPDCLGANPLNDVCYWGKQPTVSDMMFFCGMPGFSANAARDFLATRYDAFLMMRNMCCEPSEN